MAQPQEFTVFLAAPSADTRCRRELRGAAGAATNGCGLESAEMVNVLPVRAKRKQARSSPRDRAAAGCRRLITRPGTELERGGSSANMPGALYARLDHAPRAGGSGIDRRAFDDPTNRYYSCQNRKDGL